MKAAIRVAVTAALGICLSGCAGKPKTAPPAQAEAPILPPSKMVYQPTLPALPPPPLPDVAVATPPPENPEPVHPKKVARHKQPAVKQSAPATEAAAPASGEKPAPGAPSLTAGAGETNASSAIGQLSSSGDVTNTAGRQEIERLISDTENGLNGIKRSLSTEEQTTSTQIKTFLGKARQALTDNDLDGARNLANKAKELLEELTKK